jgi:hypothetical protein
MKIRFEAHSPLTPMSAIGAVWTREDGAICNRDSICLCRVGQQHDRNQEQPKL